MTESLRKIVYYENVIEFTENSQVCTFPLIDLDNLCRLCLNDVNTDAGKLAKMCVIGIDGSFMSVTEIIRLTTGQTLSSTEQLPQRLCKECLNKISSFYFFQIQVQRAEAVLNRLIVKLHDAEENATTDEQPSSSLANLVNDVVDTTTTEDLDDDDDDDKTNNEAQAVHVTTIAKESDENIQHKSENYITIKTYRGNTLASDDVDEANDIHIIVERDDDDDADDNDNDNDNVDINIIDVNSHVEDEATEEFYLEADESKSQDSAAEILIGKMITNEQKTGNQLTVSINNDIENELNQAIEGAAEDIDMSGIKIEMCMRRRRPKKYRGTMSCSACGEVFHKQRLLIEHCRVEHPNSKPFRCDVCGSMFGHLQSLSRHRMSHTPEQYNTICCYCSKRFTRMDDWKRHMRTHTGQRPYVCDKCDKAFKQPSELKDHQMTHATEKHYACDICNHRLSSRNGLYLHKKVHIGIKDHVCIQCENEGKVRRFITAGELRSHLNVHLRKLQKLLPKQTDRKEGTKITINGTDEAATTSVDDEVTMTASGEEDDDIVTE